jgi:PhnB protein
MIKNRWCANHHRLNSRSLNAFSMKRFILFKKIQKQTFATVPFDHSNAIAISSKRQTKGHVPSDALGSQIKRKEPSMTAKPIPDGYHSVTPYLTVRGAAKAIDFLKRAFGAQITHEPLNRPNGTIMHAEVKIGDSRVMIADESEMAKATTSTLYLYVPNVDSVFQQALKAGGTKIMEPTDMFYGDRSGGVTDPFGNSWYIATHKEDIAPTELAKRAQAFLEQQKHRAA